MKRTIRMKKANANALGQSIPRSTFAVDRVLERVRSSKISSGAVARTSALRCSYLSISS